MLDDSAVSDVNVERKVKTVVRVVPWYNADQFKKVHQYLYSPDLTKKSWALDQISVWETRCSPSLPAAIEASYVLTAAIVQDILWTNGNSLIRQIDLQSAYSAAVVRFVNLTVEVHKDQLQLGTTMTQIAKGLGIPSYIVDIRNEACHSFRPSLAFLRMAAEDAMKYLKKSYWDPEANLVKNHTKKRPDTMEIKTVIHQFLKTKLQIMRDEKDMSTKDDSQDKSNLKKHLQDIDRLMEKNQRLFISVLVKDFFIPPDEDLKHFVSEEEFKVFQEVYDTNSEGSCYSKFIGTDAIPDVPKLHELLWVKVINRLNRHDVVPLFMEELLRSQGDRTTAGQKLIVAWIRMILKIHSFEEYAEDSRLKKVFKKKAILASYHSMLYSAMENPSIYTSFVFPWILAHLDLSQSAVQRFMKLYAIRVGLSDDEEIRLDLKTDRILTVEDMFEAIKKEELDDSEECMWSCKKDGKHKNWPFGIIINPVRDEKEANDMEEENVDAYNEEQDFKDPYFISNENDTEDVYCEEKKTNNVIPDTFQEDLMKELSQRSGFLYKY